MCVKMLPLRCDKDPNFYYDYVALLSTMPGPFEVDAVSPDALLEC